MIKTTNLILLISLSFAFVEVEGLEYYDGYVECALCKWGTYEIENFVSSNFTETRIENSIQKACTYLPTKYEKLCDQSLVPLVPTIINYVKEHETPDDICKQLHMCSQNLDVSNGFNERARMWFSRLMIFGSPIYYDVKIMILNNMDHGCLY